MRTPLWRALAALALVTAALGCGDKDKIISNGHPPIEEPTPEPTPEPIEWQRHTLTLDIEGVSFVRSTPVRGNWKALAVMVAPGVALTSATAVRRALAIVGHDVMKRSYAFTRVLAVDPEANLALIAAEGDFEGDPLVLAPQPESLKSLRRAPIVAVDAAEGGILTTYKGKIVNVEAGGEGGTDVLFHDAKLNQGLSGAPVLGDDRTALMGIHLAYDPSLRFSQMIPAWEVTDIIGKARGARGMGLKEILGSQPDSILTTLHQGKVCLEPGQAWAHAVTMSSDLDLVFTLQPTSQGDPLAYGLKVQTQEGDSGMLVEDVFTSNTGQIVTAPVNGTYTLIVAAPYFASGTTCVEAKIGRIDWHKKLSTARGATSTTRNTP